MSNSLGALGIDLFANTATFESDMGRAARIAERDMQRISQVAATAGRAVAGGLMAAAAAVVYFTQQTIAARAALDDMADVTGDSVQFLDGLQRTAHIAGVEMGQLQNVITQTAKGLETKRGATAIGALGLDLEHLKSLKPAEAMLEIARSLDQYEDGQRKINVATAIWGKEGAKNLALMKDLAEAGIEQGRVTAEQAAAAERAEKEWRKFTLALKDAKDGIVSSLIPSIGDLIEQINVGIRAAGGFWAALKALGTINPFASLDENIAASMSRLEQLRNPGMVSRGKGGGSYRAAIDEDAIRAEEARLAMLQLQRRQAMRPGGQDASGHLFEFAGGGIRGRLPDVPGDDGGASRRDRTMSDMARAQQQVNDMLDEARRLGVEFLQNQDKQLERERERLKLLGQRSEMDALLAEHAKLQERDDQIRENALKNRKNETKGLEDAARSLGLTFSSAFEQAAVEGKKLSEVLKGLAQDVLRIFLRKAATEPLADAATGFFRGINWGSLFSGGGAEAAVGSIQAFATGTDYVPRDMLAMVHRGEAIIPAAQNSGGRASIQINTLSVGAGVTPEQLSMVERRLAAMDASFGSRAVAAVGEEVMRGGNFATQIRGG